ncbi:MAG: hypothetical protein DRN81_00990 [Thermoproteota archaeon]|nr:MAG: hypothetical protein DRN81_00990 [Candidatus Korarchaeota archaeon]
MSKASGEGRILFALFLYVILVFLLPELLAPIINVDPHILRNILLILAGIPVVFIIITTFTR